MGADQYHEPPDELPAETRTFARLSASLTEEAEAIGWYEQRLAVESDREALAIMRDAQGEEFKHFCMDLEFLLRRTPLWREIARGILFQEGDIVEHGEEAEEQAVEGAAARGAPLDRQRIARHRQPEGAAAMSHLLREHAPITEESWERIDEEARERLTPALAAAQARRLRGPAGLAALGHEPRPRRRRQGARSPESPLRQRRVLPLVEARAAFAVARAELADADRGAEDVDFADLDRAAHDLAVAENAAVFHGWKAAGIVGIAEASPHEAIALGNDCERYPRHVAMAVEQLLAAGDRRPLRPGARPQGARARAREQRARRRPAARPSPQDPRRPARLGARASRAPSSSACAAATSCSSRERTSRSATSRHDADAVQLYLEESFSFRVATPEAAVALRP